MNGTQIGLSVLRLVGLLIPITFLALDLSSNMSGTIELKKYTELSAVVITFFIVSLFFDLLYLFTEAPSHLYISLTSLFIGLLTFPYILWKIRGSIERQEL